MENVLAALLFMMPPALTVWLVFRKRASDFDVGNRKSEVARAGENDFWTLFFNAFRLRCPVCKQGKIFPGWFQTVDRCPECGIELAKESGYYIGSIYFNYGLTGAIEVLVYVVGRFVIGLPDSLLLPPLAVFALVFPLYFFRYARSSWLVFDQYFQPRQPPSAEAASSHLEYAGDN